MTNAINTTTNSRQLTFDEKISLAEAELTTPTADEISQGVLWLQRSGMAYPVSMDERMALSAYRSVLSSVPRGGLKKALGKLRRGEYENINLAFIPSPIELAAMSRLEAKQMISDVSRLKATRRQIEENKATNEKTAESKQRVRDMLEAIKAEREIVTLVVEDDMTEERRERMRKIMDMPDAQNVGREHIRFRGAVEKIIGGISDE